LAEFPSQSTYADDDDDDDGIQPAYSITTTPTADSASNVLTTEDEFVDVDEVPAGRKPLRASKGKAKLTAESAGTALGRVLPRIFSGRRDSSFFTGDRASLHGDRVDHHIDSGSEYEEGESVVSEDGFSPYGRYGFSGYTNNVLSGLGDIYHDVSNTSFDPWPSLHQRFIPRLWL